MNFMSNNISNDKIKVFEDLYNNCQTIIVRGLKVKEVFNYFFTLDPYDRFFNLKGRGLNIEYIKTEFKWYLNANRFDNSIIKHAAIWKMIQNKDGSFNSNYGQYVSPNFKRCANSLLKDKYTRQALIYLGNNDNLNTISKDYICTQYMSFNIRDNKLNMIVSMRSNDIIFGMTNDVAFFSFYHEMLYIYLKDYYEDLELGEYTHIANNLHVYERHFKKLDKILDYNKDIKVSCPKIHDKKEVLWLLDVNRVINNVKKEWKFSQWLYNLDCCNECNKIFNSKDLIVNNYHGITFNECYNCN